MQILTLPAKHTVCQSLSKEHKNWCCLNTHQYSTFHNRFHAIDHEQLIKYSETEATQWCTQIIDNTCSNCTLPTAAWPLQPLAPNSSHTKRTVSLVSYSRNRRSSVNEAPSQSCWLGSASSRPCRHFRNKPHPPEISCNDHYIMQTCTNIVHVVLHTTLFFNQIAV